MLYFELDFVGTVCLLGIPGSWYGRLFTSVWFWFYVDPTRNNAETSCSPSVSIHLQYGHTKGKPG